MLNVGSVIRDRYEIGEIIAKGGLGVVCHGYDRILEASRAIKFIRTDIGAVERSICADRFQREAQALAQLGSHPNITVVYDYGDAPCHYIVMELVAAESLSAILLKEQWLSVVRAMNLMKQICSVIGASHTRNIIHRDLKPSNILVVPTVDGEVVKVIDFGLAKLPDPESGGLWTKYTQVGLEMGTPTYMPPEQWDDVSSVNTSSDVYSLGVILYEVLNGRVPFQSPSRGELRHCHKNETVPPFLKERAIPAAFQEIIKRALSKEPRDRQKNAHEFFAELQAVVTSSLANEAKVHEDQVRRAQEYQRVQIEEELAQIKLEAEESQKEANRTKELLEIAERTVFEDTVALRQLTDEISSLKRVNRAVAGPKRTAMISIFAVIVFFMLAVLVLSIIGFAGERKSRLTAELDAANARKTAEEIGGQANAKIKESDQKLHESEQRAAIAEARLDGKDVWWVAQVGNRTGKAINFTSHEGEDSWVDHTAQPGQTWYVWRKNAKPGIRFDYSFADGFQERIYELASEGIIGRLPDESDKHRAIAYYFALTSAGEIALYSEK